ncbi:hypothetical protein KY360_02620 [Candidatus Woesearchaeota archaeon]|nr:hypothetical protein [Candidatus Woesearchaeota archaeon]
MGSKSRKKREKHKGLTKRQERLKKQAAEREAAEQAAQEAQQQRSYAVPGIIAAAGFSIVAGLAGWYLSRSSPAVDSRPIAEKPPIVREAKVDLEKEFRLAQRDEGRRAHFIDLVKKQIGLPEYVMGMKYAPNSDYFKKDTRAAMRAFTPENSRFIDGKVEGKNSRIEISSRAFSTEKSSMETAADFICALRDHEFRHGKQYASGRNDLIKYCLTAEGTLSTRLLDIVEELDCYEHQIRKHIKIDPSGGLIPPDTISLRYAEHLLTTHLEYLSKLEEARNWEEVRPGVVDALKTRFNLPHHLSAIGKRLSKAGQDGPPERLLTYHEAKVAENLRQQYLDELLEHLGDENPLFESIREFRYVGDDTRENDGIKKFSGKTAMYVERNQPSGQPATVCVTKHAFGFGFQTEQDLLSAVDNESVHAATKHHRQLDWPIIKDMSEEEIQHIKALFDALWQPGNGDLGALLEEYHSSIHPLLMIVSGRRKVSSITYDVALADYREMKNQLFEDTRNSPQRAGIELLLEYTSLDRIQAGRVQLRLKAKKVGDYRYIPEEGVIVKGNFENSIREDGLLLKVRDWIWKSLRHPKHRGRFSDVTEVSFETLKTRTYIQPLKKYEPSMFQEALGHVVEDYDKLGLRTNFHLKAVQSIDDLAETKGDSMPIYIVNQVGRRVIGQTYAVHADGRKDKLPPLDLDAGEGGRGGGTGNLKDGKVKLDPEYIFVKAHEEDVGGAHFSMYCETLHCLIGPYSGKIMESLIKVSRDGDEITYENLEEAKYMSKITDEAIVHALAWHWIRENKERFGISQKAIDREISENQSHLYLGVPIILKLVEEQGRAAVLQDYMQNPVKYAELVRDGVKDFRESPVKDVK